MRTLASSTTSKVTDLGVTAISKTPAPSSKLKAQIPKLTLTSSTPVMTLNLPQRGSSTTGCRSFKRSCSSLQTRKQRTDELPYTTSAVNLVAASGGYVYTHISICFREIRHLIVLLAILSSSGVHPPPLSVPCLFRTPMETS